MTESAHRLTELDSGVRVVSEAMPSVRSVALGIGVRTGSRDEGPEQAGISHFLEHLLFKGTDRFSSTEIDQLFDGMGAEVNAGTSKETTSVYSRFLDRHLERAFDVMADMVLRPAYPEVDAEREVVIEEIAMYEDEPSDKVHDVLAAAVFGDHPLGRPIIGAAEVISSVAVPQIAAYHDSRYVARNLVVSAAGSIDHDRLVALVEEGLLPPGVDGASGPARAEQGALPQGAASAQELQGFMPTPAASQPTARFHEKTTEQYHLCLGAPGLARADERRFALRVLDTLFGGSPSSRLFQEVREKRGLAYSVFSYSSQYVDTGQVALYVGTRPGNLRAAAEVLAEELRKLSDGSVSEQELERAKENVKGRTALSMESTLSRMNRLCTSVLMGVPVMSLDEIVAAIDAVTLEDIGELARELFAPERLSAGGIGDDEDAFRRALEAVNPALAAA